MSNPEAGARSRPLRIAGLALLGLSVGALLVGLVTLGSPGGGGGGSANPTASSAAPGPTAPSAGGGSGTASATAGATATPPPPPATPPPAAPPAQPPQPAPPATAPVRVYNNSTIKGLAAQAAEDFRREGWPVVAVSNYQDRIPTSTVYFRPGTAEEAAAQQLGTRFNLRVEPRFEGIVNASPGLIVIVTNDYGSK